MKRCDERERISINITHGASFSLPYLSFSFFSRSWPRHKPIDTVLKHSVRNVMNGILPEQSVIIIAPIPHAYLLTYLPTYLII